jgi:hypothetical protein
MDLKKAILAISLILASITHANVYSPNCTLKTSNSRLSAFNLENYISGVNDFLLCVDNSKHSRFDLNRFIRAGAKLRIDLLKSRLTSFDLTNFSKNQNVQLIVNSNKLRSYDMAKIISKKTSVIIEDQFFPKNRSDIRTILKAGRFTISLKQSALTFAELMSLESKNLVIQISLLQNTFSYNEIQSLVSKYEVEIYVNHFHQFNFQQLLSLIELGAKVRFAEQIPIQ